MKNKTQDRQDQQLVNSFRCNRMEQARRNVEMLSKLICIAHERGQLSSNGEITFFPPYKEISDMIKEAMVNNLRELTRIEEIVVE